MVLKRTFVHTYVGGRKADLPREVGSTPESKVNVTAQNAGFLLKELRQKARRYLSYAPPAYEYGTRPFLRWVLSQGRSPTRQAVPKMPRTPSAFPFSGCLRRRAINPTPPKRVKACGDGPLRPEVMYPVVEHTRTDCAARNHSRSRAPHHRTQKSAKKRAKYLSLPPTRQDLTQGQKPEGRLKWR